MLSGIIEACSAIFGTFSLGFVTFLFSDVWWMG